MIQFFVKNKNALATIAEIEADLGVGSGVGTILYRRNSAGEFKRVEEKRETSRKPATLWHLSESFYAKRYDELKATGTGRAS